MCSNSLTNLECFQGELAKRILKLPRWHSNTAACIALGWHSIHSICTIRKLRYLSKIVTKDDHNIAYRAFSSLVEDVESLCIVKECRDLEEKYCSDYTSKLLTVAPEECRSLMREAEKEIHEKDHLLQIEKASQQHPDLCKLAASAGWRRLWDHSLDHGKTGVTSLKNLVRILTYPKHATRQCPLCEGDEFDSLLEHVVSHHTSSSDSWDVLLNSLADLDPSCFRHLSCLYKLFNSP